MGLPEFQKLNDTFRIFFAFSSAVNKNRIKVMNKDKRNDYQSKNDWKVILKVQTKMEENTGISAVSEKTTIKWI